MSPYECQELNSDPLKDLPVNLPTEPLLQAMAQGFGATVLHLWVMNPLGSNDTFTGIACQLSCTPDIDITIRNSSKITVMNSNKIILWLGSPQHEELY